MSEDVRVLERELGPDDGTIEYLYNKYGIPTYPDPYVSTGEPEADLSDVQRIALLLWPDPGSRYEATELILGERLAVEEIDADQTLSELLQLEDGNTAGLHISFYGFERACEQSEKVTTNSARILTEKAEELLMPQDERGVSGKHPATNASRLRNMVKRILF